MLFMKWIDIEDIVEALKEMHPDADPRIIRFTKLREMVLSLPNFLDHPNSCNEKILEAIQGLWIGLEDD